MRVFFLLLSAFTGLSMLACSVAMVALNAPIIGAGGFLLGLVSLFSMFCADHA